MKIFVDTNIFIDILLGREPFFSASALVYKLCENDKMEGYIAPITINNIHYICRKAKRAEEIKAFLTELSSVFTIAVMDSETLRRAEKLPLNDYEDALQYVLAQQHACRYLLTRNTKDYKNVRSVEVMTPESFLTMLERGL